MKIIKSSENAYNILHDNGMQTSVKLTPSGHFTSEKLDRSSPTLCDKNKYTVIISSSHGCQMACTFCHLTQLHKPFKAVDASVIVNNVIEAIEAVYAEDKSIATKYIKLCYMGEGEALLNMENTASSAKKIISEVMSRGLAFGLDGIDISTAMPNIPARVLHSVVHLNGDEAFSNIGLNPANHGEPDRSIVRLFYSLHHYNQIARDSLIPYSKDIKPTLFLLDGLRECGINIVVHYMFIYGVNDYGGNVYGLAEFVNSNPAFQNFEFRVLRYNKFEGSAGDSESHDLQNIVAYLEERLDVKKFKVQFSAGEDVKAACGMFI